MADVNIYLLDAGTQPTTPKTLRQLRVNLRSLACAARLGSFFGVVWMHAVNFQSTDRLNYITPEAARA